ncbi:FUSC family protein [Pseudarthrobacter sp. J1763]|uniref:FUSC family protein n=1 Tax=Pseudarthrobacter sp. J1763 TaxID=3420445 RepID=UPI003D297A42
MLTKQHIRGLWTAQNRDAAGSRLLLAVKTALAVGIAWQLASLMPGVTQEYPYYAPLGAIVSMYPTFMGSVRVGFQTLLGLVLGILLAGGVLLAGSPNIITISLAVGLGVLLSGHHRLGAGREYVPMAVLFVLIVGGQNADDYSIGYLVQMALGVVVGLAVNLTILPPIRLNAALSHTSRGRGVLVQQLRDMASALVGHWPPEEQDWADRAELMTSTVSEIRAAAYEAHESQRANPRGYRKSRKQLVDNNFEDLAALEAITFHVRNITDVLAGAVQDAPVQVELIEDLRRPLSNCLDATAAALEKWDESGTDEASLETVRTSLTELSKEIAAAPKSDGYALAPGAAVVLDIERILAALRQRVLD